MRFIMRFIHSIFAAVLLVASAGPLRAEEAAVEKSQPKSVYVRIIGKDGKLTEPVMVPMVVRTAEEWRKRLTPEQYRILRSKGTEAAFCGGLLKNKEEGVYLCLGCDLPLFMSNAKFESGTGWPSFFQPVGWSNIAEVADLSFGMVRTEINCARCDSHLGHIFEDGPRPTGLRYCLNSESLRFLPTDKLAEAGEELPTGKVEQAVFSGGRFWGLEVLFDSIPGVLDVTNGYAQGKPTEASSAESPSTVFTKKNPDGTEAALVVYDPEQVSFEKLIEIHAAAMKAMAGKGSSEKTEDKYRPGLFYSDESQKNIAEKAGVITVEPLIGFQPAAPGQQNFAQRNPTHRYLEEVVAPMMEKLAAGSSGN